MFRHESFLILISMTPRPPRRPHIKGHHCHYAAGDAGTDVKRCYAGLRTFEHSLESQGKGSLEASAHLLGNLAEMVVATPGVPPVLRRRQGDYGSGQAVAVSKGRAPEPSWIVRFMSVIGKKCKSSNRGAERTPTSRRKGENDGSIDTLDIDQPDERFKITFPPARPKPAMSFNSDISDEPEPLVSALAPHHPNGSGRSLRDLYSLRDAEKLGSGGMGSCRTVRKRGTDHIFALKTVFAEDEQMLEEMRQECAIQRSLDHPNIVRVYESFEAEGDAVHIVMELCSGGNLVEKLRESPRGFEEAAAAELAKKILSAIYYMHQRGFVHRDIKLDNIMYENRLPGAEPKLIDFGFACKVKKGAESIHGRYGTLSYMAPELLDTKERGPYESSVDLWSIGVTLYTLLSGRKPFDHEDREVKKILIREATPSYSGPRWARLSPLAVDFVRCLMHKEPSLRLSASQALRHPWLSGVDMSVRKAPLVKMPTRLPPSIVQSLQAFSNATLFTRMALEVIAFIAAPQQLRDARAIFANMDSDSSGTVSRDEFIAALSTHPEIPEETAHDIFDELDINRSGQLEFNEFCAAIVRCQLRTPAGNSAAECAFKLLDKNGDGLLTLTDLQATFGTKLTHKELLQVMRSFGTVYDRLTLDDFKACVLAIAAPMNAAAMARASTGSPADSGHSFAAQAARCKSTPNKRKAPSGISRRTSRGLLAETNLGEVNSRRSPLRPSQSYCRVSLVTPQLRRHGTEP